MASIDVVRRIEAPASRVFAAVADPRAFAKAVGGVTRLEVLHEPSEGPGLRYRQTRALNGRTMTMDFEVTELEPDRRVRIVNETHGTTWDSVFTMEPASAVASTLAMHMDARSPRLLPKLLLPIACLFIRKAVARDIDAVKAWCERGDVDEDDGAFVNAS